MERSICGLWIGVFTGLVAMGGCLQETSLSLKPEKVEVAVDESVEFRLTVNGEKYDSQSHDVEWLVNDIKGGDDTVGTVDDTGRYTAPESVPDPSAVTVRARLVEQPETEATAEVTIVLDLVSITVQPQPEAMAVHAQLAFTAVVEGLSNHQVLWYVNGVKGGSDEFGWIDSAGLFTAPHRLPTGGVVVEAVSEVNETYRGSTEFPLVSVEVTPNRVIGDAPDQTFAISVKSVDSTGNELDITQLGTTAAVQANAQIATYHNGQVSLGLGAGKTAIAFEDQRYDPAPSGLVAVINKPDYELRVLPEHWLEVIYGKQRPLSVEILADRGPEASNWQDVTLTGSVAVSALDQNGFVTEGQPPVDPQSYVAWVDLVKGTVVTGAMPGRTTFQVDEAISGKSKQFSVELVELEAQITIRGGRDFYPQLAADECGPDVEECPPSKRPYLVATPKGSGFINDRAVIEVMFNDVSDFADGQQLRALLDDLSLEFQDLMNEGRFVESKDFDYPQMTEQCAAKRAGDGWMTGLAVFPVGRVVQAYSCLGHDVAYQSIDYYPITTGNHDIVISLRGQSLLENVPDPTWELSVQGTLPYLTVGRRENFGGSYELQPETGAPSVGFITVINPNAYDSGDYARPDTYHGYDLVLEGRDPNGDSVAKSNILKARTEGDFGGTHTVLYNISGVYEWWYTTRQYPGEPLGPSKMVTVISDDVLCCLEPDDARMKMNVTSTLQDFYSNQAVVELELHDGSGEPVSAIPLCNGLCGNDACGIAHRKRQIRVTTGLLAIPINGPRPDAEIVDENTLRMDAGDRGAMYIKNLNGQICQNETINCHQDSGNCVLDSIEGHDYFWAPPEGEATIQFGFGLTKPFFARGDRYGFSINYNYVADYDCGSGDRQWCYREDGIIGTGPITSELELMFEPLQTTISPTRIVLPEQMDSDLPNPRADYLISGAPVRILLEKGVVPAVDECEVVQFFSELPDGIEVVSVTAQEDQIKVTVEYDKSHLSQTRGQYKLICQRDELYIENILTVVKVGLVGDGPDGEILPIPLNASNYRGQPQGTSHLQISVRGELGQVGANFELVVSSPEDSGDFKLVGFSRKAAKDREGALLADATQTEKTFVVDHNLTSQVVLYGNLTDVEGIEGLPDGIPDVVSAQPDTVELRLRDLGTGNEWLLARTTAYVFETKRKAELAVGRTDFGSLNSRSEVEEHWNYSEFKDVPTEECTPLAQAAQQRSEQDIYLHVDNSHDGDGSGLSDMRWAVVDNLQVEDDGRVHSFDGEDLLGEPTSGVQTPVQGTRFFGVELDGVCFDPRSRVAPNSSELFAFSEDYGFTTQVDQNGLVPGLGGTSGGSIRAEDGAFSLLSRTPGVDFPGLDCGYLVEESPEELNVWDFEQAVIKLPLDDAVVSNPLPRRVVAFAEKYDYKEMILSGVSSRGENAKFYVVTRPMGADGNPLVSARLRTTLLVGEWPYIEGSDEDERLRVTARVDAKALAKIETAKWAVPIIVAAATGAAGAWLEGGSIAAGMAINVLVTVGFTAVDQSTDIDVSGVKGAMVATSTGTIVGDEYDRFESMLKNSKKQTAEGATEATRRGVSKSLFKSAKLARNMASTQDVIGGVLAGYIVEEIGRSLLDDNSIGGAEAWAYDQLWVSLPASAAVNHQDLEGSAPLARNFVVADLKRVSINGTDKPNAFSGVQSVPASGSSQSYLERESSGTRSLVLKVSPDDAEQRVQMGPETCGSRARGSAGHMDFRIEVGEQGTHVSYIRTSVTAASRTIEEATARAYTDRTKNPVRMTLFDTVVYPD